MRAGHGEWRGEGEGCLKVCWWLLLLDLPVGVAVKRKTMVQFIGRCGHCLYVHIYCRRRCNCRRMLTCGLELGRAAG